MPEPFEELSAKVKAIVERLAEVPSVQPDQDMYDAGLTSIVSLSLLLDLEDACGVTIPDEKFVECRTVNELSRMIEGLQP